MVRVWGASVMTERMSAARFRELKAGKASKYGAVRTEGPSPGGVRLFDSKKEARLARELEAERSIGGILDWIPQPSFEIGRDEKGRAVRYRADALVILSLNDDGSFVGRLVDAKGKDTQTSRTKRAVLRSRHLNVEIF